MPRTVTLADLRTAVLRRGGIRRSSDLTSAVLNDLINEGIAQVWNLYKTKRDDRLVTSTTLNTSVGVATVALPATFLELRKLEIVDSSAASGYRRLRPVDLDSQHLFSTVSGKSYRYRLEGLNLVIVPTPQAVETLRLYFIPYATVLSADGDTFNGYNGDEKLVIAYAWRECLSRQDLDTSQADARIAKLEANVLSYSDGRDAEPFYLDPRGPLGGLDVDEDID